MITRHVLSLTSGDREALLGSIEKWERILYDGGVDNLDSDCPLCMLYADRSCNGCPIKVWGNYEGCVGTPHALWINHKSGRCDDNRLRVACPLCRSIVAAEIAFLRGLLALGEDGQIRTRR
ncbi:hypothetical protein KAR91_13855 [Candidatus Pacearchaeota archaeon]|nr:hypothetical protein [Candidatus Pacearchaeota archaeon]